MYLPLGDIIETLWTPHRVTNLTKFIAKENNCKLPERQKWMQSHKWLCVGFVPLCSCSPTTILPRGPSASPPGPEAVGWSCLHRGLLTQAKPVRTTDLANLNYKTQPRLLSELLLDFRSGSGLCVKIRGA